MTGHRAQMTAADLVDRLARHRTVGAAPREELAWLAAHGSLRHLNSGDVLTSKGEREDGLYVVLSGRISMFVDRGAGLHKAMQWRAGDVTGVLPYSRLGRPPGDVVAEEPTTVLAIDRDLLRVLTRECYEVTAVLVHAMLDRARSFTANDLHDEKMVSLGKLSAGLAHELNNPASAMERSAASLENRLSDAERATRALGACMLTESQFAVVDAIRHACASTRSHGVRSPYQQAQHEEAMADWLEDRGLDIALADALADTPITFEALDRLASSVDRRALQAVLQWVGAECAVRTLASEIQDAATHIAGLVVAIKGFTHMDHATVAEPVDLMDSLDNTIAVLRSKAREKSVEVVVHAGDLPRVRGFIGELNQIWANLIDNALDAVPESGRVEVLANRQGPRVVVRIVDNGPGIAAPVLERIFDPFFTTKPMGQGLGLGLDIVRRLVRHNEAEIAVESQPGRTEFRIILPVADSDGAGDES